MSLVDLRLPAEMPEHLANVADVTALVARTPVAVRNVQWFLEEGRDDRGKLAPHGERIGWSTADVVDLAGRHVDALDRHLHRPHQVFDVQNVAHLLAIAVDGEWF